MSQIPHGSTEPGGGSSSVPAWIASGLVGLAVGAGGTVLGMHSYGYRLEKPGDNAPAAQGAAAAPAGTPGMAPGGMPGPGGGGPPMMGMGGMGMGGGGFGGGGGKRNLTSLVGKLELLSRANLKLHVELDPEQAHKIAAKLAELDKAEKMTGDEAQTHLEDLEALLTSEQKETLDLIGLPFGRRGGGGAGGRPGGGGPPGSGGPGGRGGPPGGGGPPMMGMGGGNPDENPFTQEANQKRLHDLLARLAPSSAGPDDKAP